MAKRRAKTEQPKPGLIPVVDRLVRYRIKLDLSQGDFAEQLGMPVTVLKNWEQGRTKPDRATTALLTHYLDSRKAPK